MPYFAKFPRGVVGRDLRSNIAPYLVWADPHFIASHEHWKYRPGKVFLGSRDHFVEPSLIEGQEVPKIWKISQLGRFVGPDIEDQTAKKITCGVSKVSPLTLLGDDKPLRNQCSVVDSCFAIGADHRKRIEAASQMTRNAEQIEHECILAKSIPASLTPIGAAISRHTGVLALRIDYEDGSRIFDQVRDDGGDALARPTAGNRHHVTVISNAEHLVLW